ncbi:murein hydrolase activator EnvC family protein [Natranaerobius trueperi]|uniref:Uncharacterized protein n=1 Tax=Natranaerobius trueperi TaxID=759412 RepID=A0A226C032_9FIRM|nr:peptidoglycan DD-metalloendopeptidase family protein [Natranaerobius trueperi]OWZ83717.1 hypothetical protein CDO51_07120 [Natranaerobius trueperi]
MISHKKRFLTFLLVLVMGLLFNSGPTEASDIEEQIEEFRREREQIENEMDNLEEHIEELEQRETTALQRLQQISNELNEQEQELVRINSEINETEDKIEKTTEELERAEEELEEKEEFLGTRMKASYQSGDVSYLEVLFDAQSFIDFLSRLTYVQSIVDRDVELIEEVEQERNKIQAKKEDLEDQKDHLNILFAEAEEKKQEIKSNQQQQERLYAELQEKRQEEEELLQAKKEEAEQLVSIIQDLQQDGDGITTSLQWPVDGFGSGWITSGYGNRIHPITGRKTFHSGVDIGIPRSRWPGSGNYTGSPVNILAADSGTVIFAGIQGSLSSGYGRLVIIDHGDGYTTWYAHARSINVSEGQQVQRGQPIAIVGSTGSSTGPHLHFEVRKNGNTQNPMGYLQ